MVISFPRRPAAALAGMWAWMALVADAHASGPGDHIRAGSAQVAPSIGLNTGWRSNVFLGAGDSCTTDTGEAKEPTHSGAALDIVPAISIRSDESADPLYKVDASFVLRKYLSSSLSNLDRYQDFNVVAVLQSGTKSRVGFELRNDLRNQGRETDEANLDDSYFDRFGERFIGLVNVRPGGAMNIDAGGGLDYQKYIRPHDDSQSSSLANARTAGVGLASFKWKFFPKTALVADVEVDKFNWKFNEDNVSSTDVAAAPKSDGWSLRGTGGVRGRITEKVTLRAVAGYGYGGYQDSELDMSGFPESLLLSEELEYVPIEGQTIALGYSKDFQDVVSTTFDNYNQVYGRYSGKFREKLGVDAAIAYRRDHYQGTVDATDATLRPKLDLSYDATKFLKVKGGVNWVRRVNVESSTVASGEDCSREFSDVGLSAGAVFTY